MSEAATVTLYNDATCATSASASTSLASGSGRTITTTALAANVLNTLYGKAVDAVGNTSTCTTLVSYTNDSTAPTVTSFARAGAQAASTNSTPMNFSITFSEAISSASFTAADISNAGTATGVTWTVSNSGDSTTFTIAATASGSNGTVQPRLAAGGISDAAGNANIAATTSSSSVSYSAASLTVTVNQAASQSDPVNSLPATFTVVFSTAINNATFTTTDISSSGSTATGITWALSSADNITYTLTATSVTGAGTIVPSIGGNAVQDAFGNNNGASTTSDNSVTYDNVLPTLTFSSFSPGSSGATLTPTILGTASETSTVTIYYDSLCSTAKSTATANTALASPGITVTGNVNANTTTAFYAKTIDSAGNASVCTSLSTYTNDSTGPTVTSVSSSTTNGSYKAGQTVDVTVTFSEAVTVVGTPKITLETGTTDAAVNYSSGSGSTILTFTYLISSGDTTSDLDYTSTSALVLNGGTIKDSVGNSATLTLSGTGGAASIAGQKAIVIDTTAPTLTYAAIAPTSPGTSQTPQVTLTSSEAATILLYNSAACSSTISNSTSGVAGSNAITTTTLTANTMTGIYAKATDAAGNASACTSMTSYTHDNTAPTVLSVTSNTTNATYAVGQAINVLVTVSEAVTVTGTPQITMETGSTDGVAIYSSGSGTTQLSFTYTVGAGENSSDLEYNSTTALGLNSGTINDSVGNAAILTLPGLLGASSLGGTKSIVIDTTAPSMTYTAISPGTSGTSLTPTVTMTMSEAATVTLYSNAGCTTAISSASSLASGASRTILTNTLTANAATTIYAKGVDSVNNTSTCTSMVTYTNDSVAPTITSFVRAAGQASSTRSVAVNFTLTFSEIINTATFTSADIANIGTATGVSWNITNSGDNKTFTVYASVSGNGTLQPRVNLGSMADSAGNTIAVDGDATEFVTYNAAALAVTINQAAGQSDPTGTASVGSPINFTAVFSSAVGSTSFDASDVAQSGTAGSVTWSVSTTDNVTWTIKATSVGTSGTVIPTIAQNTVVDALGNYNSASTSTDNTVTYDVTAPVVTYSTITPGTTGSSLLPTLFGTVGETATVTLYFDSGCTTPKSSGTASTAFASPGITLTSNVGSNTATTIYAMAIDAVGNASTCTTLTTYTHDDTAPTVSSVSSTTTNGSYKAAGTIDITVAFSETVTVTGSPQLTLETGTTDAVVNYYSGSGTSTLTFRYLVAAGENSADLDYASTTALAFNSGTIKDAALNNATLTLPTVGGASSIAGQKSIVVDTASPTVTFSSTSPASPGYTQTPQMIVSLSEAVSSIIFYSNAICSTAVSVTTSGSAGSNTIMTSSLSSNATTSIFSKATDVVGNVGSCVLMTNYLHDDIVPTVSSVSSTTANGTYGIGSTIAVTVTFSEIVNVTGTPQITMATGGTGSYVSGSGTTTLTFNYTIAASQTSADLDYGSTSALTLNSGTITDVATNTASLSLPNTGSINSLAGQKAIVVDTSGPTFSSASVSPASPHYSQTPTVTLTASEAATVTLYRDGSCTQAISSATSVSAGAGQTITTSTLQTNTTTTIYAKGTDTVGNVGSCSGGLITYTQDNIAPTATTFVRAGAASTNSLPVNFTVTFSEAMSAASFTAADVTNTGTATGVTWSVTQVSSTVFTVGATGSGNGTLIPRIAATGVTDSAGNSNAANITSSDTVSYSGASFTVTVNQASGQSDPVNTLPIIYTVIFSSAVGSSSFTSGDILNTSGNATGITWTLTTADNITWTLRATAISSGSTVVPTIAASAVQDAFGNNNAGSTATDNSVTYDITGPTIAYSSVSPASPSSTLTPTFYGSASETSTVTLYYDSGCATPKSSSFANTVFASPGITMTTNLNSNSTTQVYARAVDALGNAGSCTTLGGLYTHDNTSPAVTSVSASTANGNYKSGQSVTVQVTFSEAVTVTGTPQITLETGATDAVANYVSGTGTTVLNFTYNIFAPDTTSDLDYVSTSLILARLGTLLETAQH